MDSIGVTVKVVVGRFDVIKKLLEVFQDNKKCADVVFRRFGKLRMN